MTAANAILSVLRGESKQQWEQSGGAVTGEEDMYAKKGMGLNGTPVSHNSMYLQQMMLHLVEGDPRLVEHPLTVDGKYGSNTSYWVSVLLTGGAGEEVTGGWFGVLDRMVAEKFGPGGSGGDNPATLVPHTHSIPTLTVSTTGSGSASGGVTGAATPA
jgi:hypothetical protein